MIVPVLKSYDCSDIEEPLEDYKPAQADNFGFPLCLQIGPDNEHGQDIFYVFICTPKWLQQNIEERFYDLRHHLLVKDYNFEALISYLEEQVLKCTGETWRDVAAKISRWAAWEFEDYQPYQITEKQSA